jgi:hypothetical protein
MSGWQRLGIALSVLWAVVVPLWLVADTNTRANQNFVSCLVFAGSVSDGYTDADKREQVDRKMSDDCRHTFLASTVSLSQVVADREVMGYMIGIPVATLWLIGWIVIGTSRWIGRGFKQQA